MADLRFEEVGNWVDEGPTGTSVGDHRIMDESVDVERSVGRGDGGVEGSGRQAREVTPASCPMSRASKVREYCL